MRMPPGALPVDAVIPTLQLALAGQRAAVLIAAPGAGKTTRVPPALAPEGRVLVLQPRRIAARSVARRIAEEQGWTAGQEVGWHVRFERRFSSSTRVLIVTEGMLTAYLDADPLLSDVTTLVLDEFHERSLHTDVGLALARQAWQARNDLRLLVMSATLDPGPVSAFLQDCPVLTAEGTAHALQMEYAPGQSVADAIDDVLSVTRGQILCFLPGAGEIERAAQDSAAAAMRHGAEIVPLHGSLAAEAQDRALQPATTRRIVLATNIAETSLTVPGVAAVIDSGLHKIARYDAERAIDALVLERISADSADQRAGRAARLGPGRARRLWDQRDRLRPAREAEIHRVDLASTLLAILAAGNHPHRFEWFDPPGRDRVDAALALLRRLGALDGDTVTALGHQLRRLPLHPRLGRVLLDGRGSFEAAAACALLSEPGTRPLSAAATSCDLLPLIDRWSSLPFHTRRIAEQLQRLAEDALGASVQAHIDERGLGKALLAGYPDRLARRRATDRQRVILASGRGAVMGRESRVVDAEWLVALDVTAGRPGANTEAIIRMAAAVAPEWIVPTSRALEHRLDEERGTIKAFEVTRYEAIVVHEHPVPPDAAERAQELARAWLARKPDDRTRQLLARARFAGLEIDFDTVAVAAASAARTLDDVRLEDALPWDVRQRLSELAPDSLAVPSGRQASLSYRDDGAVVAAVKLQELFGLAETPRIGPRREPVTIELLAPNGRPVQTTRDLRSFWERTYPEVRKELRGRYPRHPWPDDPWTATPTHRTVRRR